MKSPVSPFIYATSDIDIRRSTFDRNSDNKLTMSAGNLYPIYVDEFLPGDTFVLDTSVLARMSTPIHPVMDDCFMDIYYFAVPNRLVWDHWKEFMGESPSDPYLNPVEYSVPQLKAGLVRPDQNITGNHVIPFKSVADYMGIPAGTAPLDFSALPFRAFSLIWNEWFRDQNLQNAIDIDTGDSDELYVTQAWLDAGNPLYTNYVTSTARGGVLPPVSKYHDYFTSATKEPQKGEAVPIPLTGFVPTYAIGNYANEFVRSSSSVSSAIHYFTTSGLQNNPTGDLALETGHLKVIPGGDSPSGGVRVQTGNMYADLSGIGKNSNEALNAYATINDLRYAFQLQKLLERDSLFGTRYRESIRAHFGVDSPDQTMQIPEFLGGKRIHINMNQVVQTSATNEVTPQGNTAAYSLTADVSSSFTKSFTEHGWIIGVACIRTAKTYQQGVERMFSRKDRYDFYFPELANISNQPIKNKEIFNPSVGMDLGSYTYDLADEYFGFQEAWAEYRAKPNRVCAEFRSTYPQSLDVWHYADYYTSQPYLSDEWIREPRVNIDRTLAVGSDTSDQFICDFYFKCRATRPMPVYSIPGLADHH